MKTLTYHFLNNSNVLLKSYLFTFVVLFLYENIRVDAYKSAPYNYGELRHHREQLQHNHPHYHHHEHKHQQRCSHRLENALEHTRRRSLQGKSVRSLDTYPQSPYSLYHAFYGSTSTEDDDYYYHSFNDNHKKAADIIDFSRYAPRTYDHLANIFASSDQRRPQKLPFPDTSVEVENLHVKIPPNTAERWVAVDKCNFSTENATLETRLIFPDLTLSGKVVLQPTGGKCSMILRLRQAGIEFRTVPIGVTLDGNDDVNRMSSASVRTDSHFAEPGFISVFAHSCQGPTGATKYRHNSKRRFSSVRPINPPELSLSQPYMFVGDKVFRKQPYSSPLSADFVHDIHQSITSEVDEKTVDNMDWSRNLRHRFRRSIGRDNKKSLDDKNGGQARDEINFNDDILNFSDDRFEELVQTDARNFADMLSNISGNSDDGIQLTAADRDAVDSAFGRELEKLFSMGVRSLLTTYMQRALQPAIKETLMENMGYTISYG